MMLGVRRAGVTTTLHILEGNRLIGAKRGRIAVLDRVALDASAGKANGLAEAEYERVFAVESPPRAFG